MASPRWTYGADCWLVFSAAGPSEGGRLGGAPERG